MLGSCELKGFVIGHLAILLHIGEVSHKVDDNVFTCVIAHLTQPLRLNVLKAVPLGDIEDKENATTALIEAASDGTEAFLASSVPDL